MRMRLLVRRPSGGKNIATSCNSTLTVIPMSVLSGYVSQIPGTYNLAHTFVSATTRAKLRAREVFFSTDWCSQLHMATTAPLPQQHSRRLRGQKPLSPSRQVEKEWSGAWPTPLRGDRPFQGLRSLQNMVYSVWMQTMTSYRSNHGSFSQNFARAYRSKTAHIHITYL